MVAAVSTPPNATDPVTRAFPKDAFGAPIVPTLAVVNDPAVATNEPILADPICVLVEVTFVTSTLLPVIPEARMLGAVSPVTLPVVAVKSVRVILPAVTPLETKPPTVTLVDAKTLPSVELIAAVAITPVADNVPVNCTLPSVTVRYAGDKSGVDWDAGNALLEVITQLPVPVFATATKRDNSGLHVTPNQLLSAALARVVHVIPLGDVITRLPVPVFATATKRDNSGLQTTPNQLLLAPPARVVHVTPLGEVITPPAPTTTKRDISGLHVIR